MTRELRRQIGEVAGRSVLRTLRQPLQVIPSLVFPLFLLAMNAGGLDAATRLPGFPTDSYLNFALAVPFMQGALVAVMNAGTDVAHDVQTGFLNRLALTPMRGGALVAGQLGGVAILGVLQALVYVGVGLALGAEFAAGVGGVAVLLALSILTSLAFGALGVMFALRLGSGEAVQGLFPVFFVLLFLSTMNLPRDLIEKDWFRTIATWNPVSYLLEGFRSLLIAGWDAHALELAFGVAAALLMLGLVGASRELRVRLVRT